MGVCECIQTKFCKQLYVGLGTDQTDRQTAKKEEGRQTDKKEDRRAEMDRRTDIKERRQADREEGVYIRH